SLYDRIARIILIRALRARLRSRKNAPGVFSDVQAGMTAPTDFTHTILAPPATSTILRSARTHENHSFPNQISIDRFD
ncbi:MAG: hypothetical protein ACR2P7_09940, partial [bacterium]